MTVLVKQVESNVKISVVKKRQHYLITFKKTHVSYWDRGRLARTERSEQCLTLPQGLPENDKYSGTESHKRILH